MTPSLLEKIEKVNLINLFEEHDTIEEVVTLSEDILVISCTLYRLIKEQPSMYRPISLQNEQMINPNITTQDKILAEEIRSDFRKKLSYFALTVGKLSKFKADLNSFLESNFLQNDGKYRVSSKYFAMAYKLPYFYEYNMAQQALFDFTNNTVKDDVLDKELTLTYITTLNPNTNKMKDKLEYWFTDENNIRVVLELNKYDKLRPLFDNFIKTPIQISGKFYKRTNYANQYYVAHRWMIVNA